MSFHDSELSQLGTKIPGHSHQDFSNSREFPAGIGIVGIVDSREFPWLCLWTFYSCPVLKRHVYIWYR